MAKRDVLPDGHQEFDTLQEILVKAAVANVATWQIPVTEIAKITAKQTVWNSTWAIAKDKQNSTTAQKKNRDLARSEYEKVLRPFIQKWIYRNENMDGADIEKCGLQPHESTQTALSKPLTPAGKVKRGGPGELMASCLKQDKVKLHGCIMAEGAPLPDNFTISPEGKLTGVLKLAASAPGITDLLIDLSTQRKKLFTNLKHGITYYFYFYTVNTAGVSGLSEPVSMVC